MEMLKWARANDAPWDESACEWAAGRGNLEALVWLVENGCPIDPRDARLAAERGRANPRCADEERFVQILSWLDENFVD